MASILSHSMEYCGDERTSITCVIVIDTQRCQFRLARATIRHIETLIDATAATVIVIRPDAFWDKQRVENCTKSHKKGEVYGIISPFHKIIII